MIEGRRKVKDTNTGATVLPNILMQRGTEMLIFCDAAYCGVDTWLTYFLYLLPFAIPEGVNCSPEFVMYLRVKRHYLLQGYRGWM